LSKYKYEDKLANNRRILIVDDEVDITVFLKNALESYGFKVSSYNEPQEALSNFKAGQYDLILLDIRMPVIDGFELHKHLQKIDPKARICFMTAYEIYVDSLKEMFPDSYSSICFIKKPFAVKEFVTKLNSEMK
jgi:DNA-binding response OmpR family regulator